MKTLLIIVLLAMVGFGLPGVLNLDKLFGGIGLLDGVERLLTNDGLPSRATSSASSSHSSEADTTRSKGESDSQTTAQIAHSSMALDGSTGTPNSPRSTGNSNALGEKSSVASATKELAGQDTLAQEGASESLSAMEEFGILEDTDEDASRASADKQFTTSGSVQSGGVPKTVIHTQFVVVAPGERSTLLIAEPESFSAMDSSAYAPSSLSAIGMTVLSLVGILCQ